MSRIRQRERFGRVTGNTLRRSLPPHRFKDQFVITKRTRSEAEYEHIDGQLEGVLSDGDLRGSRHMVYSLNKQKRWEIPNLLKESICNDRDTHADLDFKVLLVEHHLDAHDIFHPACTGLYESKTPQPERLPRQTYAHAGDLRCGRGRGGSALTEAARRSIHKLRCAKNRGGRKVDWRGLLDVLEERAREEGRRSEEEEERMPQLRYEVGYGRPESKYPWRPEMKLYTLTSKRRSASTTQRHRATTAFYLEDVYDTEDCIQEDILGEVLSHSETDSHLQGDTGLVIDRDRPSQTLGDALHAATRTPRQKKRRKQREMATRPRKDETEQKARVVYDPEGARYRPRSESERRGGRAATLAGIQSQAGAQSSEVRVSDERQPPSAPLQLDEESIRPARLEADFGRAYAEARSRPRRFAVQVGADGLSGHPGNKVYLLFECSLDDPATVQCTDTMEAESWQVVKTGVHVRMTVFGLMSDQAVVASDQLSASFPSDTITPIQDVVKYMQDAVAKSATRTGRTAARVACSGPRHNAADIPTTRAALGWNCWFSTADEAYSEITGRHTPEVGIPQIDKESLDTSATVGECGICYESLSPQAFEAAGTTAPSLGGVESTVLSPCGHSFCDGCWRRYLRSGVTLGATDITCPEYKCVTPVDPVTTMAFLSPAQFHAHYRRARDATVARSAECHRCPNPLCGRVACRDSDSAVPLSPSSSLSSLSSSLSSLSSSSRKAVSLPSGTSSLSPSSSSSLPLSSLPASSDTVTTKAMTVRCDCGWLWCTECKEEGHWPASCQQASDFRKAMKKLMGELKKDLITHVQVKRCPGCKTRWEKNGGCPSMICGTCSLNFCWMCLRSFEHHDNGVCAKSKAGFEAVRLDYSVSSRDYMLDLAIEHHRQQCWTTLRKCRFALNNLASRAIMARIQSEPAAVKFRTALVLSIDVVMATASADNHQPLTWARTKEQLQMMSRRAEETFEIAVFCHECHFVLEHLFFLLGSLPRSQQKAKWWRATADLRFIVQNLQQTLDNVPNIKTGEAGPTMDRLCRLVHAGKGFLRRLALSMPRVLPQGRKLAE